MLAPHRGGKVSDMSADIVPVGTEDIGSRSFRNLLEHIRASLSVQTTSTSEANATSPSNGADFQILFSYRSANDEPGASLHVLNAAQSPRYELFLEVIEQDDSFVFYLRYDASLFDAPTVERIQHQYFRLLESILAAPDLFPEDYSILPDKDLQDVIHEWNKTKFEYPADTFFHELFEIQSVRIPDKPAIFFGEQHLTYRDLNHRSDLLAKWLRSRGVCPGVLVGLCVERSLDMVVGLLGILKSGGAYVPLGPDYPADRLKYMAEDSGVQLILTQQHLVPDMKAWVGEQVQAVALDRDWDASDYDIQGAGALRKDVQPDDLAYLMYTSGSTGRPKGVMIPHRALTNFLVSMGEQPGLQSTDKLLAVTTYCFDISGLELYLPLLKGGQCFICSEDVARDGKKLLQEIRRIRPSVMQATPATWTMLFHAGWDNEERLKILCGGEALPDTLRRKFIAANCDVWNMYGPTETTIWSTLRHLDREGHVNIGKPIANTQIYIVDQTFRPVPVGAAGELCIAGDGLAKGYWNRPDITAEKFIANPFPGESKLYRTGDLARWRADGTIDYLGRIDHQVKIRGFRIELGEIEARLNQHPAIGDGVVVVKTHEETQHLVCYYMASEELEPQSLRKHLKEHLPDYMVPHLFVHLQALPLTPNGKTDRKALMERELELSRSETLLPVTALERQIWSIWKDILHIGNIGTDDGFFEIGGTSVSATALVERINQAFGCDMTLARLVSHTTISALSRYISSVAEDRESRILPSREDHSRSIIDDRDETDSIAIVGMAGKFPGAEDLETFWENVEQGRNCIVEVPETRWSWKDHYGDPVKERGRTRIKWGGFIEGIDEFDPLFFGIAPREAELMDPQQRLLMTYSWLALEHAGIAPSSLSQQTTGVFIAASAGEYRDCIAIDAEDSVYGITSEATAMIPSRISYTLNLHGPSELCETTCSSSLVAIHRAIQSMRAGECEQAIVGGVNLLLSPKGFSRYEAMGLLSTQNEVKSFQAGASGYLRAEGVGVVVLKPLSKALADGDLVYALLKGSGVSHGGKGMSLTSPNGEGMKSAMIRAYTVADVDPRTVAYIETHGIASPVGDSIEIDALKSGYKNMAERYRTGVDAASVCYLSCLKPTMGHGEIVSGMAALMKVALALRQQVIPGLARFSGLHEGLSLTGTPFQIVRYSQPWSVRNDDAGQALPRRASINSYGFGASAHLVLEEYPSEGVRSLAQAAGTSPQIIILSARTKDRLKVMAENLRTFIQAHPRTALRDLAYTLQVGREAMRERVAILAGNPDELTHGLVNFINGVDSQAAKVLSGTAPEKLVHRDASESDFAEAWSSRDFEAIARAWINGAQLPWASFERDDTVKKVALPTYPFERKAYWAGRENPSAAEIDTPMKRSGAKKRICVVGAGPAGLVMAKSLLEEGHEPVVYEAGDTFGGVWNLKEHKNSGAYKNTRFQNSADTSFFSDFPATAEHGLFPGVTQVRDYLEAYAERFDLKRRINYRSRVVAVAEAGEQWRVEVRRGNEHHVDHFDGVALCHGRYHHPALPAVNGLSDFQGEVLHSGQYFDNRIFEGKRVLVVGNGVSGMDIAEEASHVARATYWSMRSLKFVLPRMVGYLPNDFISPANLLISPDNSIIMERLKNSMPDYYAAYQKSGLFPDVEDFRANPFVHINDGVIQRVADGAIQTFVEDIARFTASGCVFKASGTEVKDLDMVVMCTGYDDAKSFEHVKQFSMQDDFAMGLFYHRNPSLVNAYGIQNVGTTGTLPYLEMVARWYAQVISGHYQFSKHELEHRIDKRDIVVAPLSNVMIGLKLGLLPRPEQEFEAFWRCLNTPSFPPMYRLRGPHAAPEAQSILSRSIQRSFIPQDDQDPALQKVKYRLLAGLGDPAMRDLLERQEITADDYRQAENYRSDPIVLSWDTQFIKPAHGETDAAEVHSIAGESNDSIVAEAVFSDEVKRLLAKTLKLDPQEIGLEQNLSNYGFSSVTLTAFSQKITDEYGIRLAPSTFMEHATLKSLSAFMYQRLPDRETKRPAPSVPRREETDRSVKDDPVPISVPRVSDTQDIAIIGLGGKLPGARDLGEFWRNLLEDKSPITSIPEDRWSWKDYDGDPEQADKTDCHRGAFIDDVGDFDPLHFKLSPREAVLLDPQHRLLLEAAWETLENAGYAKSALFGQKVGCFIGVERQDYANKIRSMGNPVDGYLNTGNSHAMLVNRVSHFFGWKGPTLAVDTACSSSFTALHAALRSLQNGDAELALAGGVNLVLAPDVFICNRKLGLFTGEDHVKPFDRDATGHFFSDGLGLVLLKPLASAERDGDHIYGVIKGMSVRHGGQGVMLTFPNPISHREVIEEALQQARLQPSDIDYIEGQGTANPVTDIVELKAYHQVFARQARPVPIGTIKGHMGHFAGASGVLASIKALLSLQNNQLIKVANFKALNWEPDDEPFSCEVLSRHQPWPSKWVQGRQVPRRIGVHNFGFGGVTGHLILEEHLSPDGGRLRSGGGEELIVLSARKADQLVPMAERLLHYLEAKEYRYFGLEALDLGDVAYTLQVGREPLTNRMALLARSLSDLIQKLRQVVNRENPPDDCWWGSSEEEAVSLDGAALRRADLRELAQFWLQGRVFDWGQLNSTSKPKRVPLPTYPFSKARYWVQAPDAIAAPQSSQVKVASAAMPHEVKGMIPTLNGTGTMTKQLLACSESFVDYAGQCEGEVLDLGCAYGGASLSALERGARVFAVDMDPRHLEILTDQVHGEARSRIATQQGMLPALDLDENRFAAIHAGRVLHFLNPEALQETMAKLFRWLQPGGKLFVTCDTPYFPHWAAKLSDYEAAKAAGDLWPGYIANLESFFSERSGAGAGHAWDSGTHAVDALKGVGSINLIDPDILRRESIAAGFDVEKVGFEGLAVEVNGVRMAGGFEHVGLIAVKPLVEHGTPVLYAERPSPAREVADKIRSLQIQPDILSRTIRTMLAAELGIQEAEIEDETKFFDLGLNSAIGVSWMNRINETYGLPVPAAKLFSYPTLRTFSRYLLDEGKKQGLFNNAADVAVSRPLQKETPHLTPASTARPSSRGNETDIAIIGMSCRFPQSRNKSEFWEAIRNKRDCIGEVPENRWSMADYYDDNQETPGKTNCRFMGALDDADCFDPMFFHISPLEARHMDPQQRLFLEEAWSCLEDAGYATDKISGSRCGVFVGYGNYGQDQMASAINAQRFIGASPSILAARIAYFLNLQGPCLTIDTACSASLVAVAQACNSLLLGDSDLALAGGVSVLTGPAIHIMASKAGMLSNDGRCFTLDQRANGFVPGEGVGVVALKRLADAQRDGDIIYGLVRGWGVNQDGSTNGITAPNQEAQIRLQRDVYDKFGIDPSGLQYVEMHGTGTKLGDPIEVDALVQSFQSYTDKQAFCALGSVKSNVGHTLAAAGIAGMIKMLMAFQHRQLPPTLHVEQVNEHINLAHSPFHINTECKAWDVGTGEKRRAAVNSFGYSGTNAHVVLEAYDDLRPMNSDVAQGPYLIVLSARNKSRLQMMMEQLLTHVTDHESLSLADLAYTLQTGRMAMEERIGLIVETRADLIETCKAVLAGRDAANIYRGQTKKHDDVLALFSEDEDIGTTVGLWMHKRRYSKLLALWVRGLKIDWHQLYDDLPGGKPRRISLPTYPFARERYWQNMPSNMASGDAFQKAASEEANSPPQPAGQQDRAISEPIATVYPEHANFRYLTKQWEPASANPHPSVGKRIAILATEETQALARELLRILPTSEVLNPDDIHASLKQSGLSSSGFAGCIDLIGCGRGRHEPLEWLEWLRRLVAEKSEEQRMLLCVSHGLETHGNSVVNLSGASRVGLYRMLQSEYSALQSRHMDADPYVSGHALAKQIVEEFSLRDQMAEVCYRNGQRYKAVLREVSPASGGGKPRFSEREVVWITGGTRGLGLLCAQHLVKRHGVKRLLLSGQEKWPPRHEWPDCIAQNHPRARQMSEILALAEQGVEVRVMSIPLTDETTVRESLANVRRDMGPIGGLIHCAGMMDTETPAFIRKSVDGFRQVLSPKIAGLDLILSQVDVKSLRCVILFSSVAGIIPTLGAGQSDYAMANAYMDYVAYAYMNDCPMISIQWPHWGESEKGELKSAAYASTGLRSHTHREGLRLLDQILSSDMGPVVLPAVVNPDQWKPGQLMNRRIGHTEVETAHLRPAAREVSAMQAGPELSLEAVRTWLLALFCKELEIPAGTVQTDTDFHHYGVDSILLSQLTRTIGKALTQPMDPSVLFDHSTIDALAAWLMDTHEGSLRKILGVGNAVEISPEVAALSMAPDDMAATDGPAAARRSMPASRTEPAAEAQPTDIAIIGMSCRFPGAHDLPAYWRLLSEGRNAIARVPRDRWGYASSFHAGLLDSVTRFDPDFFQIPETDARLMDPQALLVLEETLNLFSHAGYSMAEMRGTATGVYLGARSRIQDPDAIVRQAKSPIVVWGQNYMAANVSHFFDLRGPSLVIDTACSSALVAMHSAIDSLRSGENGFAVVGGVNLLTDDLPHRIFQQRNLLSPEPAFHIFDQRASGVVLGEGAGLVLLKTRAQAEKDGDTIYAVIKALAINNDGRTAGPTTPSIQAQKAVMQAALAKSGKAPGDIGFIEANGSGSEVTDLLELKAIEAVYRSPGQTPCGLGSIKPNIGHPLCAEGIAGLIKLTLMLKHKQHVPFLSGTHSMTHYSIDGSPFFFHRTNEPWFGMPRVAALSCFADGGTNAHLILEEWEASDVKTARRQPIVPPPLHRKDLRQQPLAIGTTGTDKNWWGTPLPETA
jgi:amino acid adenylation domain-containing protein